MTSPPAVVDYDDLTQPPPGEGFGEAMGFYRTQRRLSLSELGNRTGFDHSYISRLEKGEREPTLRVVIRVAKALKLTPAERIDLIEAAGYTIGADH